MIEIILLSIVQGITEFLPISSSAHLVLISNYLNFNNANLTLDISLHLGSLLAIIFYFRKDINNFFFNRTLVKKILITSIPTLIFGFILVKLNFAELLRSNKIIGWTSIIFGIFLFISDQTKINKKFKNNFKYKDVLVIGLLQIFALIPGVSRSGVVITSARFLGYNRVDSTKISLLTSIPILIIISCYNMVDLYGEKNFELSLINALGTVLSFLFSYTTIVLFFKYIKNFSFILFVIYRIVLGLLILNYV